MSRLRCCCTSEHPFYTEKNVLIRKIHRIPPFWSWERILATDTPTLNNLTIFVINIPTSDIAVKRGCLQGILTD